MLFKNNKVDINAMANILESRTSKPTGDVEDKVYTRPTNSKSLSEKALESKEINLKYDHLLETMVFNVMRDIAINSIPVDESKKTENDRELSLIFESMYEKIGGFDTIKEAAKREPYLRTIVESLADILETKKIKDKDVDEEVIITQKDEAKMKDVKMDAAEVSDVVKDKVVQVIKDEAKAYKEEKEKLESLKSDLETNFPKDSKDELEERFANAVANKKRGVLRENTLYSSLMSKYKKASERYVMEGKADTVNMDEVMATAITEYTIMEFFNTLNIKNYKRDELNSIISENTNPYK